MTIYLYVKTHNKTGLKYLGMTKSKDPHKYKGSGIYWVHHLAIHGCDYSTEIIKECIDKADLTQWGLYYSNLWNVVESLNWANLKPESGDGNSSDVAKEFFNRPEIKLANIERQKQRWKDPEYKKYISEKLREYYSQPIIKELTKNKNREINSRPDVIEKQRISHTGPKNYRYNHTEYIFLHKDGRVVKTTQNEICKIYNLSQPNITAMLKGRQKSVGGWSLG